MRRRGSWSVSVRGILVHMIEEYARYYGHADLLRESIDGETGE
ncbi:MAG: DinB family protein [Spirochaetaceae bacterium]|nr:DinB family protein [Spirochaetaceae bacterium]